MRIFFTVGDIGYQPQEAVRARGRVGIASSFAIASSWQQRDRGIAGSRRLLYGSRLNCVPANC